MSYIVLNLDTTAPNVIVVPESGSTLPVPFEIYVTSDESGKIYYTLDGSNPVIDAPNTHEQNLPFVFNIVNAGTYVIKYITKDDVGNVSNIRYLTYYASSAYTVYNVTPKIGVTTGGTIITVSGEGFNFGAIILLNDEPIPTEYGGEHKYLYGRTLPMPAGTYNIRINDPMNGLSVILINAFTFIEPQLEERIIEVPMVPGETRKHIFETDQGTMILVRKMVENFDIDNLVELRIKDLCVNTQLEQAFTTYPAKVNLE